MSFTVAIDGPAAAGKGTISRAVAARFGFAHLDTGLLYRATGRRTLNGTDPVAAARALTPADLDADDLRTPEVAQAASRVAAIPEVRQTLLDFQRAFATRNGGAVLDGRDIGTVICPDAQVKLFVTANDDVRARRRHAELTGKGMVLTVEPGLYFDRRDKSIPAEFRGIGVRIEDDVLITAKGPRVLTDGVPKEPRAVERACQGDGEQTG